MTPAAISAIKINMPTADRTWSWIGTVALVLGVGLIWWGVRSPHSGE